MSTSLHNGLVSFATNYFGTDDDPVDNVTVKDGIANGLLHCADSMGQVRVNWMATTFGGASNFARSYSTDPETGVEQLVMAGPFGLWPLTLRADGTPYKLRVRLAGSSSSGGSSVKFYVVIAPPEIALSDRSRSLDSVWTVDTSSTSTAWLSGTTEGSDNNATMITVSADQASEWIRQTTIYDAVSSGSPKSIEQCLVSAVVYGQKVSGGSGFYPRLHALHIQEYLGT